ncbi:MAG: putative metal-binding motif-containing protein, partial [Myxococcota bacterium]
MKRFWLPLVGLAACDRPGDVSIYDLDGDGALAGVDCDDRDPAVGPTAGETCNGLDDDCDGEVDEELLIRTWPDADRDGFGGDGTELVLRCAAAPGWVENHLDCDDTDAGVYPDRSEVCDGRDQDCDTIADEGLPVFVSYLDVDQDNFGQPDVTVTSCDIPFGYANNDRDCDDLEPTVNPNGVEVCNRIDEDCDGVADEGLTVVGWIDADHDGYGNDDSMQPICPYDEGFVVGGGDCDDGDAAVSPDGDEVCNGFDDDCDGIEDDGVGAVWYLDADGDGFGDPDGARTTCFAPAGFVADATDCDDVNAASFPGNAEACDDLDNDCNGEVDDGLNSVWYADLDGDGLGDPFTRVDTCLPAPQFVQVDGDCDDSDAAVPPACPPTLFGRWTNHGGDGRRSGYAPGTVGGGTLTLEWELDFGAP